MSVSEDQITKKINEMKALASRRIDKILVARSAKHRDMRTSFFNSIFGWLKK